MKCYSITGLKDSISHNDYAYDIITAIILFIIYSIKYDEVELISKIHNDYGGYPLRY